MEVIWVEVVVEHCWDWSRIITVWSRDTRTQRERERHQDTETDRQTDRQTDREFKLGVSA